MIDTLVVIGSIAPVLFLFVVAYNRLDRIEQKLNNTIQKFVNMEYNKDED